ncbi:MAG: 4Fe-4S dicluster domain-containing protein [Bacteroidetes bacterium]|nr:4Fe-4S dicluster domain-containing protein [Bacteroidota bacterium]
MAFVQPLIFTVLTVAAFSMAGLRFKRIYENIRMGQPEPVKGSLRNMILLALGQKKMFRNLIPALLHLAVYTAFLLTQVELLEIFLDGFTGRHRLIYYAVQDSAFGKGLYIAIISGIEVLSLLAFAATLAFLARRNLLKVLRFVKSEMNGWPRLDGNIILYLEIVLIAAIFTMNGADEALHRAEGKGSYGFLLSGNAVWLLFSGFSPETLAVLERVGWWFHILVVFSFLNYLPFSKHLHIMLAFPNAYFTRVSGNGQMRNMPEIQREIQSMLDPSALSGEALPPPDQFGAKDVQDLSWKQLLDAYACTECGRCTAACPANQTGKKLSPRKIMMDTRDRMEELSLNRQKHGPDHQDGKALLGDYISTEELRACTTCNACVQECPVSINPLSIILELRRHLILDQSSAPESWTQMFTHVENNGAPWQFAQSDRDKWISQTEA